MTPGEQWMVQREFHWRWGEWQKGQRGPHNTTGSVSRSPVLHTPQRMRAEMRKKEKYGLGAMEWQNNMKKKREKIKSKHRRNPPKGGGGDKDNKKRTTNKKKVQEKRQRWKTWHPKTLNVREKSHWEFSNNILLQFSWDGFSSFQIPGSIPGLNCALVLFTAFSWRDRW